MKKIILFALILSGNTIVEAQQTVWESPYVGSSKDVLYLPDANAVYWRYGWNQNKMEAQKCIKIQGEFPNTRYFSYNIYNDDTKTSITAITDVKILPDNKNKNLYTLYIVPEGSIIDAKNVLYFPKELKNISVILRHYLPEKDIQGEKKLPIIEQFDLKTKKTFAANESTKIPKISKEDISKYLLPFVTKILESSDEEIKKLWKNFKNEPMNLEEIICKQVVSNAFNFNKNENKLKSYNLKSDGTYPNKDNHYLTMPICKQEDEVCIIRFKTPSYPTKKEEYAMSDVRYYSISQGDEITYNHKTLSDKELVVSKDGYVYIIIGEEGSEITDFANTKNINFMPWLVKDKMLLIYRNMLPNPTYKNGVNCVPGYDKNNPEKNHEADFYIGAYAPMGIKIKKSILKTMHNISEYFN